MISKIAAKLIELSSEFREIEEYEKADEICKIAEQLIESYKPRIKRQRRSRGVTKMRRKKYYKRNRQKIKRKQKRYRRKTRVLRKRRKRMKHYKRVGEIVDQILLF